MRARRQFRPGLDFMPSRLAPSGVAVNPMDPGTAPTTTPPAWIDPMHPTGDPSSDPGATAPTISEPGSFLTSPGSTALC